MKAWFVIMQKVALFALNWTYNYIDYNKDGKLSKKEIRDFTKKVKSYL